MSKVKLAVSALADVIVERARLPKGTLSAIVCTCRRCKQQELFAGNERAAAWVNEHGGHGALTFALLADGCTVVTATGTFG